MVQRLSVALEGYNVKALQKIAGTLGVRPTNRPVRKSWLVGELSRVIPQRAGAETTLRELSAAERAALAVVLAQDPNQGATLPQIAPPLILAGLARIDDTSIPPSLPTVRDVLLRLMSRGLVLNTSHPVRYQSLRKLEVARSVGIAPEVRAVLPAPLLELPEPQPSEVRLQGIGEFTVEPGDATRPLRELFFTWAELRRAPAKQLKAGGIGKRDRRRIAGALGLEDDEGLDHVIWLHDMLWAMGLVAAHDGMIRAVESGAATLFWSTKPVGQLPDLLQAYVQLPTKIVEIPRTNPLFRYYSGLTLRHPSDIRRRVIALLGQVAGSGWLPAALFRTLLTGGDTGSLVLDTLDYIAIAESLGLYGNRQRGDVEKHLRSLERQLTAGALRELRSLGIVDLGFGPPKGRGSTRELTVLRASSLTRDYYTNRTSSEVTSEEPWQVILQPDFQVLALGPVPVGILMALEQIAHREKLDDSVVTYRLTRDSVYGGFQRGETVTAMLSHLEEATGQPAPQNVVRSLEEWARQFERIVVRRQVQVLQVDTPDVLQQAMAEPDLGRLLHPLDARTAWFFPRDLEAVQGGLFRLEWMPAHSKDAETDLVASMRWHNGDLRPRAAVPSLYVTHVLQQFAEAQDGHWRVTRESTRAAVAAGMDAPNIIDLMSRMTGEPLSPAWRQRIQAWSHHYGESQVARVSLVRFVRPTALEEIRGADPELSRWLSPLPGSVDTATIDEQHLDEAKARLAEWGVNVSERPWW